MPRVVRQFRGSAKVELPGLVVTVRKLPTGKSELVVNVSDLDSQGEPKNNDEQIERRSVSNPGA